MLYTVRNIWTQISEASDEGLFSISVLLTFVHSSAYLVKKMNPYASIPSICLLDEDGRFPTGLLGMVTHKFPGQVEYDKFCPKKKYDLELAQDCFKLKEVQERIVSTLLENSTGIVESPTGSGKTIIKAEIFRRLGVRTLILAPRSEMVVQITNTLKKHIKNVGNIGRFGGGHRVPGDVVDVSTIQSAKHAPLDDYKCVIIDEVHHCPASTYTQVLCKCENAYYRYGVSGTTTGRSDGFDVLIPAFVGPTRLKLSLEDVGGDLLCRDVRIIMFRLQLPPDIAEYLGCLNPIKQSHLIHHMGIQENWVMNNYVVSLARLYADQGKVLIFVDRHDHGSRLASLIEGSVFISSAIKPVEKRMELLKSHSVVIATSVFSEGLDDADIDVLINAAGGKSALVLAQRLGRGLRAKKDKVLKVFDFLLCGYSMLERHGENRLKKYKEYGEVTIADDLNGHAL